MIKATVMVLILAILVFIYAIIVTFKRAEEYAKMSVDLKKAIKALDDERTSNERLRRAYESLYGNYQSLEVFYNNTLGTIQEMESQYSDLLESSKQLHNDTKLLKQSFGKLDKDYRDTLKAIQDIAES